jgi:DNA-binding transcriptional regulator LsrR (DeoR family)
VAAQLGSYWSKLLADTAITHFGIAWGNTLYYGVRAVTPIKRPELNVVSVMGGLPKGSEVNSFEIAAGLAELYGATPHYLTAPVYASTRKSRDIIVAQEVFQQSLITIRRCDAITTSVGDLSTRSLLIRDGLPGDVSVGELAAFGAVGDIMGHFIDGQGHPIAHDINQRVIGIDPWELRGKPNIALASGGLHKVDAILAALRTGIYDAFVSDQRTATKLLSRLGIR